MKKRNAEKSTHKNDDSLLLNQNSITIEKKYLIQRLIAISKVQDLNILKKKITTLKGTISGSKKNPSKLFRKKENGSTIVLRKDVLLSELNQIIDSQTIERAKYYIERLENGIQNIKTGKINDINLLRWKEYDDILTDSLWIIKERDSSGAHLGWYWGNFIPQIPHQLMARYTKQGEWALDPFAGSGTTLIECRRCGRNGIGIELNPKTAQKAKASIEKEQNKYGIISEIIVGDSRTIDCKDVLKKFGTLSVQLLILHPPYHDIIKFSDDRKDLSNTKDTEHFLTMFGNVIDNVAPSLDNERFCALVIGDKYSDGEWIPLGFYCMNEVMKRGFILKSIIVKNFDSTRAKRNQQELWRYRALAGGFYIFKHEYIMLFQKVKGHTRRDKIL